MLNVQKNPLFTPFLVQNGVFAKAPLNVLDVGARGGPQPHWPVYGKHIQVLGFEPYVEECARLNSIASSFKASFTCYPVGLGSEPSTARLYEYSHNKAANSLTPPENEANPKYTDISIVRFDDFAREQNISYVDFAKIDIERHELYALQGMRAHLESSRPILGMEVEIHYSPNGDAPLLSEIELFLRPFGYVLVDLDMHRKSSDALPSLIEYDHRNQRGEMIMGPTATGRLTSGDALFMLDTERLHLKQGVVTDPLSLLKLASLYDVYGFPDVAAELILKYEPLIAPLLAPRTVEDCLNAMVPDHFGAGLTYREYLKTYDEYKGRAWLKQQRDAQHVAAMARKQSLWLTLKWYAYLGLRAVKHPVRAAKFALKHARLFLRARMQQPMGENA